MERITKTFIKLYPCIMQLPLSDKRKIILCSLIATHETVRKKGYLGKDWLPQIEYNGTKYHFYFEQKTLYTSLGMAQRTFESNLQWLQSNGYLKYKAGNRQGYITRTTYFLIETDFIVSQTRIID